MTIIKPEIDTDQEIVPYEDVDDNQDHLTHIVNPPSNINIWRPGMSAQDMVDLARINGLEIQALCGYRWVPKRNPDKYPVCQSCMDIAGELMRENDE